MRLYALLFGLALCCAGKAQQRCGGYSWEQDVWVAGYHSAMAITVNGLHAWGDATAANGYNDLALPTAVTPANGYAYAGTPLLFAHGDGPTGDDPQSFILTTVGLYAWGYEHAVIPDAATSSSAFQSTTLPVGVTPIMVRSMTACNGVLALLSTTGNVYVRGSGSAALLGDGSSVNNGAWHQAAVNGVSQLKAVTNGFFVITANNTWYTWGPAVYLGNSSAVASRSTPQVMTKAFTGVPKMIAITNDDAGISYYALDPVTRKVHVLGENANGRLGIGHTTDRVAWTTVRNPANTADLAPVASVNATDNSPLHNGVCAIMADSMLYFWGENDYDQLGSSAAASQLLPIVPAGFTPGVDKAVFAEMAGHYSLVQLKNSARPCFVGHRCEGNVGDGNTGDGYITSLRCDVIPDADFCVSQRPPVALNDAFSMNEDQVLNSASIAANDSDPDNAPSQLSWSVSDGGTATANGSLVLQTHGLFSYTPQLHLNGAVSFTYKVCDPSGLCAEATAQINIQAVNDAPDAQDDHFTMNEDGALVAQSLAANDSDVDHATEQLAWALLDGGTAALHGALSLNSDGSFSWIPEPDLNGVVAFTYRVCDVLGACDQASVSIAVVAQNDAPVAMDEVFTTQEDQVFAALSIAANDHDADDANGQLGWAVLDGGTAAANGALTLLPNGTLAFAPAADRNGTFTFTYRVCDPQGLCDTARTTIIVLPVNDAPVAIDDAFSMDEDGILSNGSVSINDTDVDDPGAGVSYTLLSTSPAMSNGSFVFLPTGSFTWTPGADFNGTASFTYQVCDVLGLCAIGQVTITVLPVNDAPMAGDDAFIVNEDETLSGVSIALNDTDADDALTQLTFSLMDGASTAESGSLALTPDGVFAFVPDADFNGNVHFTYRVCDGSGACDEADVLIQVRAVNDPPVAEDEAFAILEDGMLAARVDLNDADRDDLQRTWTLVNGASATANGTLALAADGSFSWVPTWNFNGTVMFTYRLCDEAGLCDQATATIVVTLVNDAPTGADDMFIIPEGAALIGSVAGNDADVDDPVSALLFAIADPGTAGANGTLALSPNGALTYLPDPFFHGMVSFTYRVCDPQGACDPLTRVVIDVGSVNDAPLAVDHQFDMAEDGSIQASLSAGVHDPDGDALTYTLLDGGTAATPGTISVEADGTFTFIPGTNANGTCSFSYQVCDPSGVCDQGLVTIAVVPINDVPFATNDDLALQEDGQIQGVLLGSNDGDVDDVELIWSMVDGGTAALNGALTLDPNGSVSYVPQADHNGTVSFTYRVCDGHGGCDEAVVNLQVTPVNDAPDAGEDQFLMEEEGQLSLVHVSGNDHDVDDTALTWAIVNSGSAGANGVLALDTAGQFTYTPYADVHGLVSFTYRVCDPLNLCDQATVWIEVVPVNDAPTAGEDHFTMAEDGALIGALINTNDADQDDEPSALVWSLSDGASAVTNGELTVLANGTMNWIPAPDFSGQVSFTYTVCDAAGACANAETFIEVLPVNDAPVAQNDDLTIAEDEALNGALLSLNDHDVDDALPQLTYSLIDGGSAGQHGTLNLAADGSFDWWPAPDHVGTVSFAYRVCDPAGACDQAVATIEVTSVNDVPAAEQDHLFTSEDAPLSATVAANDGDVDQGPLFWSLLDGGSAGVYGALDFFADGTFNWVPDAHFNGTVAFTYQVCDADGACDQATVAIDVAPVNDAPTLLDDVATTLEDTAVPIEVLANDQDADAGMDMQSMTIVSGPAHGAVLIQTGGTIVYMPQPNYYGTDTFSYSACDAGTPLPALCGTATVVVTITSVNDDPVVLNDEGSPTDTLYRSTPEEQPISVCLVAFDTEAGPLDINELSRAPEHGVVEGLANGDTCFTYTPAAHFAGSDTLSIVVNDVQGGADTVVVIIDVIALNHGPQAVNDHIATAQGEPVLVAVLLNDSDPDGDVLSIGLMAAIHGDVLGMGGQLRYSPDPGFCGMDTITYTACDPGDLCSSAIAVVHVICAPFNDPPTADDDQATVDGGGSIEIDVLANDGDPNGDAISVFEANAMMGSVTITPTGTINYQAAAGHCGTDTIHYRIQDEHGAGADAAVLVEVICALDDALRIPQGFSPNGDGIGDTWTIHGLESYPRASVTLFNRWGSPVFQAEPYKNDWDGRCTEGLSTGERLPAGTYWYLLDLGAGNGGVRSGYVYLIK